MDLGRWPTARPAFLAFVGLAELCVGQAGRIQDIDMHVIFFTSHIDILVIDRDRNQNEQIRNR